MPVRKVVSETDITHLWSEVFRNTKSEVAKRLVSNVKLAIALIDGETFDAIPQDKLTMDGLRDATAPYLGTALQFARVFEKSLGVITLDTPEDEGSSLYVIPYVTENGQEPKSFVAIYGKGVSMLGTVFNKLSVVGNYEEVANTYPFLFK